MKLWNYIGEFFLFRWLLGKLGMHKRGNGAPANGRSYLIDEDRRSQIVDDSYDIDCNGNYCDNHDWNCGDCDQSFDDFDEEQDDYDMMDDF